MREFSRIERISKKLKKTWKQSPDLRLGQLLICIAGRDDIFNIEDDEWEELIDKKMEESNVFIPPKVFCPKCGQQLRIAPFENPKMPALSNEFPLYKLVCDSCDFVSKESSEYSGEIISKFLESFRSI